MTHSREIKIDSSRTKKLHLMSFNPKDRPKKPQRNVSVSVSKKFGTMTLGNSAIIELIMDKKFVRIYYDIVQSVLAWKVRDSVSPQEMGMGWKLVKKNKQKLFIVSIKSILDQMNLKKPSYTGLEVKKWKDYSLLSSDDYYYVEIR